MDYPPETYSLWAITADEQCVEIEKTIAQQSNLLMVLQEAGMGTPQSPIAIRVSKKELDFFCSHLTSSAQKLLTDLSDTDYSKLMDITEWLKCPLFYAELMEALMTEKQLVNAFALNQLNDKAVTKPISEHFTEKKCIKKSNLNREKPYIAHSNDDKYFTENISNNSSQDQIHLWSIQPLKQIKTFPGYSAALFSPDCRHIIIGPALRHCETMAISPFLYSIEHDTQRELVSDHKSYHQYNVLFDPQGRYFLQTLSHANDGKKHILTQLLNENKLTTIELAWGNASSFCFIPEDEHLLYINGQNQLIRYNSNNPSLEQILLDGCGQYMNINIERNQPLLISLSQMQQKTLLYCSQDPNNKDQLLVERIVKLESPVNYSSRSAYSSQLNRMAYNSSNTTLQLIDDCGNKIAHHQLDTEKHQGINHIVFHKEGNYLASLNERIDRTHNLLLSSIILWNLSDRPHIPGIRIDRPYRINECSFTKAGNLLTHGNKTELWNMNGTKIATLGKNQNSCHQIADHSFLLTEIIEKYSSTLEWSSAMRILSTKLYHVHIDEGKIAANIEKTKKSLSLSQALLLNAHHPHRKDKKPTILYPNMPDGRALASLRQTFSADKQYKILAKNFKLKKHPFIPKNLPISQQQRGIIA